MRLTFSCKLPYISQKFAKIACRRQFSKLKTSLFLLSRMRTTNNTSSRHSIRSVRFAFVTANTNEFYDVLLARVPVIVWRWNNILQVKWTSNIACFKRCLQHAFHWQRISQASIEKNYWRCATKRQRVWCRRLDLNIYIRISACRPFIRHQRLRRPDSLSSCHAICCSTSSSASSTYTSCRFVRLS